MDLTLSVNPTYVQVTWGDYAVGGSSNVGLISYASNLYDGLACNDGHLTLNLVASTSYVKANVPLLANWLQSATVELWVKP